jgi:ubiquinone/menaquinone biosynthesis C-methylase UbiE
MLQNPVKPRNGALSLVNRDSVSAIAFRNSIEQIRRRYQRLAPIYPVFELVFLLPRGIRHRAVHRMGLASRDSVLEVGCGTGRNLRHLVDAVGENGRVYALDCCEQMLRKAGKLCQKSGWRNVELLNQDAAQLELPGMVDGVLFSLSYSVMPDPRAAVEASWKYLRPGKSLVIVDGKLARGICGRLSRPWVTWLSKKTILGDPMRLPWGDLGRFDAKVEIQEFNFGTYYICKATKNASSHVRREQSKSEP